MKQVFEVGTAQYFTYSFPSLFKRNRKITENWVIRNVKYIYAGNEEGAKEKYKNWFFKEYKQITHGWGNWYLTSDKVDMLMSESLINITSTEIVVLDNKYINASYEDYRKNMQADDFKEWWFDNHSEMIAP